jgi:hypothetical protein
MRKPGRTASIRCVNLEDGMPLVRDALAQLERELAVARQQKSIAIKIIHGYGSSGVGGEIRIAVQKRLREAQDQGAIRVCHRWTDLGIAEIAARLQERR